MSNQAVAGRFYVHYKGGLYFVNKISYDVDKGCDVVTYTHVGGRSYIRTVKGFEEIVSKYNARGELNPEWGDRPGSFCVRFFMLPGTFKIDHRSLDVLMHGKWNNQ